MQVATVYLVRNDHNNLDMRVMVDGIRVRFTNHPAYVAACSIITGHLGQKDRPENLLHNATFGRGGYSLRFVKL